MKVKQPEQITPQSKNFSRWYTDVVLKAQLADYAPVRGCMVIRPYGYALWERYQKILDGMIKKAGVPNAYFPLFIPWSFLQKEKEHVEDFSPQTAVVTHGGGKKLKEPLIVRPTSETIMYYMYSRWISSWRDLPLKINQWANVVRWEMRTSLFLRTTEFLWQEGHTAHATLEEAEKEARRALRMYQKFYEKYLALYPILGVKSNQEKFAGAEKTYTVEIMMKDGKSLQAATSHNLGQNFAKSFNITFQDKDKKTKYVWQTSWGLSTRAIGGLIMGHGDDHGLVLPPRVAPIQAVIIPIWGKEDKKTKAYLEKVKKAVGNVRLEVDLRQEVSPGWKFNEWEVKGVPIRIEIGPREQQEKTVTLVRRDQLGEKITVSLEKLKNKLSSLLEEIQESLYQKHKDFTEKNSLSVDSWQEFKKAIANKKFVYAYWCGSPQCEEKIKEETKATTRCLPLNATTKKGKCVFCGKPASQRWLFARSY